MYKNINKGFTLIELLIVIAIIGVLAATVVVSLGSKTDDAREKTLRIGVSSIRTLASSEVASGITSSDNVCLLIFPKISADKERWPWGLPTDAIPAQGTDTPSDLTDDVPAVDANDGFCVPRGGDTGTRNSIYNGDVIKNNIPAGAICCATSGSDWMIWGLLPGADGGGSGKTQDDVYCADSKQFLGDLDISNANNLQKTGVRCQG